MFSLLKIKNRFLKLWNRFLKISDAIIAYNVHKTCSVTEFASYVHINIEFCYKTS